MQQLDIFLSFNHFKQIALTNFSCKFFESCTSSEDIFKTFFQIIMCIYFNFFSKDLFVFTESQTNNPELVLFFENILFSVPEDILNFLYVSFNQSPFENFFENFKPVLDYNSSNLKIVNKHYLPYFGKKDFKKQKNVYQNFYYHFEESISS